MNLVGQVNQNPDAIVIASSNWISRVPRSAGESGSIPRAPTPAPTPTPLTGALPTRERLTQSILTATLMGTTPLVDPTVAGPLLSRAARDISHAASMIEPEFGPDHFETECGIKVRGAT